MQQAHDARLSRRLAGSHIVLGALSALGAGGALTGCGPGYVVVSGEVVFHEVEPNDSVYTPNHFGLLESGEHIAVDGYIDDSGYDPFDGFAVVIDVPCQVDFTLYVDNHAADLDLCVFNGNGAQLGCFVSPGGESGNVRIDGVFGTYELHFVVNSFVGASTYRLELGAHPIYFGAAVEAEADAEAAEQLVPDERRERFDAYFAELAVQAGYDDDEAFLDGPVLREGLLAVRDDHGALVDLRQIVIGADGEVREVLALDRATH